MRAGDFINMLLFIVPCIIVLYPSFSDRLKAPGHMTAAGPIAAFMIISIFSTYIYFTQPLTLWSMAFLSLCSMLAGVLIFNAASSYSFAQGLFVISIIKCYSDSVHLISYQFHFIVMGRLPSHSSLFYLGSAFVITLITLPVIFLFFRKLLRPALDATEHLPFWNLFWGIPVCSNLLYFLTIFPRFNIVDSVPIGDLYATPVLWIVLSFSTYIIILKMIMETTRNAQLTEALHITEMQVTAQRRHTEMMQQKIKETRHIRHDFRHTLLALQAYLSAKDYESMTVYLNNYLHSLNSLNPTVYCENAIINAIISYYMHFADEQHIETSIAIQLDEDLSFPDTDMCILLGNLLENAVEACQRQDEGQRYIDVKIHTFNKSTLVIVIENSYNGYIERRNSAFISAKAPGRHGIGIASILNIAGKYNGVPKFEYDSHAFKVSIMISRDSTAY